MAMGSRRTFASLIGAALLPALLASSSTVEAAVTVFTDELTFLASAPVTATETFERFEGGCFPRQAITIDGVRYRSLSPPGSSWFITGSTAVTPPNGLVGHPGSLRHVVTFGPRRYVHAFGFSMIAVDDLPGGQIDFFGLEILVAERHRTARIVARVPPAGGTFYFGFVSDIGIARIIVRAAYRHFLPAVHWVWDDVSRSEILGRPELPESPPPLDVCPS
jgi:hypothetical protein